MFGNNKINIKKKKQQTVQHIQGSWHRHVGAVVHITIHRVGASKSKLLLFQSQREKASKLCCLFSECNYGDTSSTLLRLLGHVIRQQTSVFLLDYSQ